MAANVILGRVTVGWKFDLWVDGRSFQGWRLTHKAAKRRIRELITQHSS